MADAATCDWPGCAKPAEDKVPILRGMALTIDGVPFTRPSFHVCDEHVVSAAQLVSDAIDDAMRRHAARTNLAPGDAEWNEYFGDD